MSPSLDAALAALTGFVAVAMLVSGLDDLFVDLCYYLPRRAPRAPRLTEKGLREAPEQPVAIMIPAWHEHAVIGRMLRNTARALDYRNYEMFVGTYPNDAETLRAVAAAAAADPRVHRVVCPHDGPTNKADCLNWIIDAIRRRDEASAAPFRILALFDSEDIVHPLSLKVMNRLIPEAAMVQLPVIPLEPVAAGMTAGTYLDEFAETHLKDLVVRERLCGMVPSAGVGTGFARDAVDELARRHGRQVFNVTTFTEDYDVAFRLRALSGRCVFVQHFLDGPRAGARDGERLVGTREYFPTAFRDAVRQRSRWTLGIVFQGWEQRGWEGGLALRYMTWRDRKTLITSTVTMLGYALFAAVLLGGRPPLPSGHWIWTVVGIDTLFLLNRWAQRVLATGRLYGARQAAVCLPRIVWGNVINFCAVSRAAWQFGRARLTGAKLVWAKTAHAYPSEEQLTRLRRGAREAAP